MAKCPSCDADVPTGARWCAICRANVITREVGRLASPGRRLGAYFFDLLAPLIALSVILGVSGAAAFAGVLTGTRAGADAGVGGGLLLAFLLWVAYVIWALVLFARGTTPGKRLLGMRVVKADGRNAGFFTMLAREWIGKPISGLFFLLGYLWILFDRDSQGWHDKLVSTYVVVR